MAAIGLFYGSETGSTEEVAETIQAAFGDMPVEIHNIAEAIPEEMEGYDYLIIGAPTWDFGGMQSDWDRFLPQFEQIDFNGKMVAFYGLGDQEGFSDYYLDAMGDLWRIIKAKPGVDIVGYWPVSGYFFDDSQGLTDDGKHFVGLALDVDNEDDKTQERVDAWVELLKAEGFGE